MLCAATITDCEFNKFRHLIYDNAGISLNESKRELLRSRLSKRLRALGLDTYDEYYDYILKQDRNGQEFTAMLDCISTNKTDFFREIQHFDFMLNSVLPDLRARADFNGDLRIWSAGCSTGEEPYSIALALYQDSAGKPPAARILASDLSTRVLQIAHAGIYSKERIAPVPPEMLAEHFTRCRNAEGEISWQASAALKSLIAFKRINLMEERWPIREPLHLIFCRNVMIYFDRPTQQRLVQRFHDMLHPGGYLFIGHSESLSSIQNRLKFVRPTVYQRVG